MSADVARMNGGAVMCDTSPLTVARKEMKSFSALRLPSLATIVNRYRDLECSDG